MMNGRFHGTSSLAALLLAFLWTLSCTQDHPPHTAKQPAAAPPAFPQAPPPPPGSDTAASAASGEIPAQPAAREAAELIAAAEMKAYGYDIASYELPYITPATLGGEWEAIHPALPRDEAPADAFEHLVWSVLYTPKDLGKGGSITIYIDQPTGKVLNVNFSK